MSSVNFTGTFLGTLKKIKSPEDGLVPTKKEDYPFELTEVVTNRAQLSDFKHAIMNKAAEFRNY
ncbi:hypothetical protein SAMN05421827_12094 [Pedobacter terrae]|uniref:Uncharacterized protein n=1 Tax=Pedobacter terrae TaxID=405671 RepID=A0A1G8B1B4_9SPHI|nr:hypothetical protein SAMN05421827_12094 [Pedobacter terrae]